VPQGPQSEISPKADSALCLEKNETGLCPSAEQGFQTLPESALKDL
jgi:hypothetical protein